ncbi:hypothetical protein M0Q97_09110 [Candidatus Dojkabacteria bacterium]|jgi:hypothetical protein|nr:hypothetical protein [Candidatus Dojkabacteria bacterium]
MENLKQVNLENLTDEQIVEHKENILKLEQDSIIEYLSYALDTYYSSDDNQENTPAVEKFFDSEEFRPFYSIMLHQNDSQCDCADCAGDCDCDCK